jgi:hypothetical protein
MPDCRHAATQCRGRPPLLRFVDVEAGYRLWARRQRPEAEPAAPILKDPGIGRVGADCRDRLTDVRERPVLQGRDVSASDPIAERTMNT